MNVKLTTRGSHFGSCGVMICTMINFGKSLIYNGFFQKLIWINQPSPGVKQIIYLKAMCLEPRRNLEETL
ncbi:hypothetical protein [uncultured Aliiroseovarius sp.]|uniref:hypothetical protein n=1 Tax=uncultured Aliiroseovarius sp. TaxID=1658783 RepID=UPI002591B8C2|nr:hypothetical protein [uncultured Aliiroseovarius sp.]